MMNIQLFAICPAIPEKMRFPETLARCLRWFRDDTASDLSCGVATRLCGGGQRNRPRQERLPGTGGFHALPAMGIGPAQCHISDGLHRCRHGLASERTGHHAFTTRVTPGWAGRDHVMPGFTTWAGC